MIKVTVLYPASDAKRFDMRYFLEKHIPMVRERLGEDCLAIGVDQGVAGGEPNQPAPYVVIGHLMFDALETFQSSFAAHGQALVADIPNYTDIAPVFQVSEVRL